MRAPVGIYSGKRSSTLKKLCLVEQIPFQETYHYVRVLLQRPGEIPCALEKSVTQKKLLGIARHSALFHSLGDASAQPGAETL
jgi:hypothetical protein